MTFTKRIITVVFATFLFIGTAFAQKGFFKPVASNPTVNKDLKINNIKNAVYLQLDEQSLRTYLLQAKMEFANNGITLPLEIPLPNGTIETFNLVESPVLAPNVAADHPEIKTYTGNGTNDKKSIIRLSLTSSGFNAIILNVNSDAVYFEKSVSASSGVYFSYFAKDAVGPKTFNHNNHEGTDVLEIPKEFKKKLANTNAGSANRLSTGNTLTTFRLAMAADAEFVATKGGTATSGFNAVVAYVNRIVAFYRNELSISFTLVSGTNLIYTNAISDPYDNSDQSAMMDQNISNCNTIIGLANYDIAHVWGTTGGSGGGVAYFESLCNDTYKGGGVSGEGNLTEYSQVFMDQLVFHEMGHQCGMSHSYNSVIPVCTTREPSTSVEPGSGATIMSYGFTCYDDDHNDDYYSASVGGLFTGPILQFHTASYIQSLAFLQTIQPYPAGVVVIANTGNTAPVISMPTAHTIPKSTPFALTGTATDIDGDALSYCWEGTNLGGNAANPPTFTTLEDPSKAPFSRSYAPIDNGTRIFPVLDSILNGSNDARGDKLPSVSVAATYNLTVRDNHASAGGVTYGSVTVTVNGAIGPFLETTNLSASYPGGSTQTITWSVNGTNTATPNIKISLSTDGGHTFPTVLLASTPNDGTQAITLPNVITSTARIKVEAVGNIFFDISNVNFAITAGSNTITASAGVNGTISPIGAVSVSNGANQTFTITPNACYRIDSVLVDGVNNPAAVTSGTYTFTNVTVAHTIRAVFKLKTNTITVTQTANGTISPATTTLNCGSNQTFTITPSACYNIATVLVDGVNNPAAVTSGTYTFTNVTSTHTITATYVLKTNAITVTQTANGTISPATTTVNCGSNQTFTITPSACYNIATVLVDGVNNPAAVTSGTYTFTNVTSTHTITATYVLKTNTITASAGANGTISPNGATVVNCGANQTYTITPNGGFNVLNVLVDGVSQGAITTYTFSNVTSAHTISVTFVSGANTITASAGANGTITPSGAVSVGSGANQTFTITPNTCYNIATVLVDGVNNPAAVTSGTYTFTNVTTAHTISATFVVKTNAITVTQAANGTISPATTTVNCGTNQTFTITPSVCYKIATVLVDGVNIPAAVTSGTYTFTNVTTAHTITATYVLKTNAITVTQTANGTISPATTTVNCGSNQTFTITPSACYNRATVLVDGVNNPAAVTSGTYTFTNVTTVHTITATYSSLLPANAGAISGATPVCKNQNSVTYTVPVIAGATSYIWTLPTGATGTSTTNTINVNFGAAAISGNITVKGNNTCGNGITSTLAVTVNAKPTTPTATFNVNVLSSSAASGNQWYNQNGIITGATTQNYTPIINGSYYTIVTLSGCSSDTSNKINVALTGIHLTRSNQEIKVYPNPVSNQLMIEIKGNNKTINMEVLNAIGQVVYTNTMVDKTTIPTIDFAVGVYIIKLKIEDSFEFIKIIKQ